MSWATRRRGHLVTRRILAESERPSSGLPTSWQFGTASRVLIVKCYGWVIQIESIELLVWVVWRVDCRKGGL